MTWIKVEKPVFDLVGVILSSLGLTAICAAVALALGTALGCRFILRTRREAPAVKGVVTLHLLDRT